MGILYEMQQISQDVEHVDTQNIIPIQPKKKK
jgi:hypothetical protein